MCGRRVSSANVEIVSFRKQYQESKGKIFDGPNLTLNDTKAILRKIERTLKSKSRKAEEKESETRGLIFENVKIQERMEKSLKHYRKYRDGGVETFMKLFNQTERWVAPKRVLIDIRDLT